MTIEEILAAIAERFPNREAHALAAVNAVGALVWSLDEWEFREGEADLTATAGSQELGNVPPDLGRVDMLVRDDGTELEYLGPVSFQRSYGGVDVMGTPVHFTRRARKMLVGPAPSETALYVVHYDSRWTMLAATTPAEPETTMLDLLPEAYHRPLLVNGPMWMMQAELNDPTGALNDQVVSRAVEGLRAEYLGSGVRGEPSQVPPVYL